MEIHPASASVSPTIAPMTKPNLFTHATSELSQDAFLCWLLGWADPACREADPYLHNTAQRFINHCLHLHGMPAIQITALHIKRQHLVKVEGISAKRGKIDILVTINNEYVLLIEDKAGSTEGKKQLEEYLNALKADIYYEDKKLVPIYVQTSEQASYVNVEAAEYVVIKRQELIEVLAAALADGCENAILQDFYEYLAGIEAEIRAYNYKPLHKWNGRAWQGFYGELQSLLQLGQESWRYVGNRAGGFHGFWWAGQDSEDCWVYLQLEQNSLCFKIRPSQGKGSIQRYKWRHRLVEAGKQLGIRVVPPGRLGDGETITVARLGHDYRIERDGKLDLEATVKVLRDAEEVLRAA